MNCIIASTSTLHGGEYLAYLKTPLKSLFNAIDEILFIPYARPGGISHDVYTAKAKKGLSFICKNVVGIHEKENAGKAIAEAQAIFVGGGNTFLLVKQLYENGVMLPLKKAIENGTPYLGTSAGSNICGPTMQTTNDMPIVYPPNFDTMGILPFNLNAHYLDPDPSSTHNGETRETRIAEFHTLNKVPVIGLREGSWLEARNNDIILKGPHSTRIFKKGKKAFETSTGSSLKNIN